MTNEKWKMRYGKCDMENVIWNDIGKSILPAFCHLLLLLLLPPAYCLLLSASCLLPPVFCPLPTAYC